MLRPGLQNAVEPDHQLSDLTLLCDRQRLRDLRRIRQRRQGLRSGHQRRELAP